MEPFRPSRRARKYRHWYRALIEHARKNPPGPGVYSEKHHALPRCMGGSDKKANIVRLTAKQHIVAHDLLARAYGHRWKRLWIAAGLMHRTRDARVPLRVAATTREEAREAHSKALRGRTLSEETKRKLSEVKIGKKHTDEARKRIGEAHRGRPKSAEQKAKLSLAKTGQKRTEDHKRKISEAMTGPGNPMWGRRRPDTAERSKKHEILRLWNEVLGREESGSRTEMRERCRLSPSAVSDLVHRPGVRRAGWRLVSIEAAA